MAYKSFLRKTDNWPFDILIYWPIDMSSFVVPFSKAEGSDVWVLPNKKNWKIKFSVRNPYTQLFVISTIKAIE